MMDKMDQRGKWIKQRFGRIDASTLGRIQDLKSIVWIDLEQQFLVNERRLTYRPVRLISQSAGRIAEIFRNGAYEMINNSEIEWHHDPEEIIRKVQGGDWNFYGCYLDEALIAVESMHILRGDRIMEWVWGCVDPPYRGLGVWRNIGVYTDRIVELSGAQVGSVWVVTSHKYSQMSVEKAGYVPMACFIGKRIFGGSDNRYYRHTLIHYAKLYGDAKRHLQNWEDMELTEKAGKLVQTVRIAWEQSE